MNKCNSIRAINIKNLSEQTKFRLDEISKIENYFIEEINQIKSCSDKILMLAKSQLYSIDTLISQALIDMDISHEEFITILKEKYRYKMMKDNLKNKNGESYKIMRFNSVKSKKICLSIIFYI